MCTPKTQKMSSEVAEPLNLVTINYDCKEHIFEYLEYPDLISLADTSKQLRVAIVRVFNRKYMKNGRIDFGLPCGDV